ncbi:hypothetical protein Scep_029091 [Stephania cephalantha]|uniref:RIN4 pathogenic type III effector avirulence factor Avr cleavage site domain-containing protein n=1 Tax=Stephania cephalantha TaxID=152367 RepID=A0AAP0HH85_9MAGN
MANPSHIPKFGNWDGEENVPYTAYFDKARKVKGVTGGRMINPNDPQDNPDLMPSNAPTVQAEPRSRDERRTSREDGDPKRLTDSPLRHDRRTTNDSNQRQIDQGVSAGDTVRKAGRPGGGSDRSVEQSPLHPHYQARVGGRGNGSGSGSGVSSPAWERRSSEGSHGLAPNTPNRSRLRNAHGDETPDKGAAIPKFGEWDENDPSSADGFTHIFNKAKEEKQGGSTNVPSMPTGSPYRNGYKPNDSHASTNCFCFSWGRK